MLITLPGSLYAYQLNKNQIFIGPKALNISYDTSGAGDDELSGFQLGYSRVFQKYFEFRGSYFKLEHDDFSELSVDGFDLGLVAGKVGSGFNIFGGAGFFTETWDNSSSHDFSGLQLIGGIGYNWQHVGLDFILAVRDPSDYEDFVESVYGTNTSAGAASASINVGWRF